MWRLDDKSEGKMPIDRAKTIFIKCLIWLYHLEIFFDSSIILTIFINIYKICKQLTK